MAGPFNVYGPFEFDRNKVDEKPYVRQEWDAVDKRHMFLQTLDPLSADLSFSR
jgi:hypothetical protein